MKTQMNTLLVAAIAAVSIAPAAQALEAGDIIVRFGAATVAPNVSSGEIKLDGAAAGLGKASVNNDTQIGFSGTYMFSSKWGVEVLAATPFEHDLTFDGGAMAGADIGSVKHLPPTVSAQFYPMGDSNSPWQPYVGVGVNYTVFFSEDVDSGLDAALGNTSMDLDDSFGLAAQAGLDYYISDKWLVNASVMYADISTTATIKSDAGVVKVNADLDPWVYRLNLGYKF
ncbi:Outer membrane protein W [Sinobacterium norvegicum]|uniref:Outer membrane protein W n=1 Tax=Sinobacterium norvegicum TaxID=1641715 RepID=A0ABN8EI77_9GAMM|nr:OmpW family outer membrane protein [Sinobacterium norvegicum]CAH0990834.1 Outer membrane protein W [Sinobacterium norvegicum]